MTEVKVAYDFDQNKIDVDVLVRENDGKIVAALPVIPRGNWEVTWHLRGDGNNHPIFDTGGIEIGSTPAELGVFLSATNASGGVSWALDFNNDCDSLHQVQYNIIGNRGGAAREAFTPGDFLHDPSISVVTDPPTP